MTEWQPIETAPVKKSILLCSVVEDLESGTWHYYDYPEAGFRRENGEWYFYGSGIQTNGPPTHWMPLPPPPTTP